MGRIATTKRMRRRFRWLTQTDTESKCGARTGAIGVLAATCLGRATPHFRELELDALYLIESECSATEVVSAFHCSIGRDWRYLLCGICKV